MIFERLEPRCNFKSSPELHPTTVRYKVLCSSAVKLPMRRDVQERLLYWLTLVDFVILVFFFLEISLKIIAFGIAGYFEDIL